MTSKAPPSMPLRSSALEISAMPDGYVVYDPARDRVHYLNASSALILELCDGETTPTEIADAVRDGFDLAAPPVEATLTCIDGLIAEGLVTASPRPAAQQVPLADPAGPF